MNESNSIKPAGCRSGLLARHACFSAHVLLIVLGASVVRAGPNIAPNTVAGAVDRVAPAVVKLYGEGMGRVHGYGTGVLVSSDGLVLTTYSLLARSRAIRVVLSDGRTFYNAKLERADEYRQLALIKIDDAPELPFLEPAGTEQLATGDTVIAMGNWYKTADGDEPLSLTRGILGLKTHLDARRLTRDFDYTGPILVYDAITSNPGAPGSPLLDIHGNFVGLVGKIVEAVNTNTRLNYAIPSEEIAAFLGGESKTVSATKNAPSDAAENKAKPYLGIKLSKLGYRRIPAYVERIRPGSPAAKAGIKSDDLIWAVNNRRVSDAEDCRKLLAGLEPGQTVQIVVKRGGRIVATDMVVGEKP